MDNAQYKTFGINALWVCIITTIFVRWVSAKLLMLRSARKSGIATTDMVASGFNPMRVK
jgi:hypothetical protein